MKYFIKKYLDGDPITDTKKKLWVNGNSAASSLELMMNAVSANKEAHGGNFDFKDLGFGGGKITEAGAATYTAGAGLAARGLDFVANKVTGHQPDAVDGIANAASLAALLIPPPWGQAVSAGITAVNAVSKLGGSKIGGFDGDVGIGGVQDYSMEAKSFRMGQTANARAYAKQVQDQLNKWADAKAAVAEQNSINDTLDTSLDMENRNLENQLSGNDSFAALVMEKGGKMVNILDYFDGSQTFTNILDYLDEDISYLQNGGMVIPSGALHKNRHNIENEKEELKGEITHKGIPVITYNEDGTITQHAEIEENEVILELSLTKKLEKYWKENTEESAIAAGKMIVENLFNNCDDNTGLLKEIKV